MFALAMFRLSVFLSSRILFYIDDNVLKDMCGPTFFFFRFCFRKKEKQIVLVFPPQEFHNNKKMQQNLKRRRKKKQQPKGKYTANKLNV